MLSPETLDLWWQWWNTRPSRQHAQAFLQERWLFPGRAATKPKSTRQLPLWKCSVLKWCASAQQKASPVENDPVCLTRSGHWRSLNYSLLDAGSRPFRGLV